MPKLIPQNELDAVQEAVARFPEGAAIEEVSSVLAIKMPRRTLQRRLALLVEQKRLKSSGALRSIFLPPEISESSRSMRAMPNNPGA